MDLITDDNNTNTEINLLIKSYFLFQLALNGTGKLGLNERIKNRVGYLIEFHNLETDDIIHWIYERFSSKKQYLKYDSKRASLRTYILHYTNTALLDLIRKYDSMEKSCKDVPVNFSGNKSELPRRSSFSSERLEKDGIDGVIEYRTPEDYYLGKELLGLMANFFDRKELMILIGLQDRATEAIESEIEYQTICKRIQRKREAFKAVLKDAGYL